VLLKAASTCSFKFTSSTSRCSSMLRCRIFKVSPYHVNSGCGPDSRVCWHAPKNIMARHALFQLAFDNRFSMMTRESSLPERHTPVETDSQVILFCAVHHCPHLDLMTEAPSALPKEEVSVL
jgi:hypothetical protein